MTTRRVDRFPSAGSGPSLWYWTRHRNLLRVSLNYALMALARVSPSFALKNALYRLMGARVGERVAVGLEATFDVMYPELIEIGDDVIVGYSTTILCHEYLRREHRTGRVVIEDGATIGANCTILPGVTVGRGATVSAMSLVNKDVPPGELWGGVPARKLRDAAHSATGSPAGR